MTITMTSKNQITIPKNVVNRLHLKKGCLFNIKIENNCIKLIPMELVKRSYTDDDYRKLEEIYQKEKHTAKPMPKAFLNKLKKG